LFSSDSATHDGLTTGDTGLCRGKHNATIARRSPENHDLPLNARLGLARRLKTSPAKTSARILRTSQRESAGWPSGIARSLGGSLSGGLRAIRKPTYPEPRGMSDPQGNEPGITQLLIAWGDGSREALDDLMPLVYEDLRRVAAGYMWQEGAGHALQPTALVHEAYVRLIDQKQVKWRNRAHFFGVAAGMMRRILVDHARRRRAEKRGADSALKRDAAAGTDGETWRHYGEALEDHLRDLAARIQRGAFRASPVRRAYIPKADGRQRPLGVPTLEDEIVQRAVVEVFNAIYEQDFLGFSYGFRPKRTPHQALDALTVGIETRRVHWRTCTSTTSSTSGSSDGVRGRRAATSSSCVRR